MARKATARPLRGRIGAALTGPPALALGASINGRGPRRLVGDRVPVPENRELTGEAHSDPVVAITHVEQGGPPLSALLPHRATPSFGHQR